MKKVLFVALAVVLFATIFLAACGKKEESTATPSPTKEPAKPVTLNVMFMEQSAAAALEKLAGDFTAKNPNITVKFQYTPNSQYKGVIRPQLLSGEGPDLFMTYPDLASFADDLSGRPWAENLLPAAKAGAVVQGRLIQMPMTAAGYAVYYNTKIFTDLKLEVPTTYEQFLDVCKKIKDAKITPLALGMKDGFVPNSALSQFLIDFYANQSPDFYSKLWSGETKISENADFKAALEKFLDLNKKGYFSPGVLSDGYEAIYKEVADGKSAMIIQGSWLPSFATGFNKDVQLASFILPNPSGKTAGSLLFPDWNLGLNKNSKNKDAAIQFLDFLAQADSLSYLSKEWKAVPAFKGINVDLGDSQKGYLDGLANYTSYLPWYPIVSDPNYEFIKVLTDVMSNKTSLADALKKYDDILQQNKGALDALYKK